MVDQQLEALAQVRQVLAGGDVLSRAHVRKFLAAAPNSILVNGYGPTEATTFTCCYRIPRDYDGEEAIPIGPPLNGTYVYVVDENGAPVPAGETGELWIGGDGVGRGYLNAPELTKEKFISNLLGPRIYRTGDLARVRPDGVVEFFGRADRQVKIRGFRIEPDEIEAAMSRVPGVRDAVVCVDDAATEKRLIAYVTGEIDPDMLRERLASVLPAWMVPAQIVAVDNMPLTVNGKVDRQALAKRTIARPAVANASGLQGQLQSIWRRVLAMDALPDQNFFDLGGSSLQLMRIHAEVERELAPGLSITELFRCPTIRSLAGLLEQRRSNSNSRVDSAAERARKRAEALGRRRLAVRGGLA